jgi:hypothetical protein
LIVVTENQDQIPSAVCIDRTSEPTLLETIDISTLTKATKKLKSHHAIVDSICQFKTENERIVGTTVLNTIDIKTATMTFNSTDNNEDDIDIDIITSQDGIEKLARRCELMLHVPRFEKDCRDDTQSKSYVQEDYMINTLRANNVYSGILKYSDYAEPNETVLDLLNRDWKNAPHYRLACLQALVGAIAVEGSQILFINCLEIYGRKPSIDVHHERFSGNNYATTTLPTPANIYKTLNITTRFKDSSTKLMICSKSFNSLVVSSLRLDIKTDPELGPTTLKFSPSTKTKLYLCKQSLESANKILASKQTVFNDHDFDSHLRQLRSKFTHPDTYLVARKCHEWTDTIATMPYTVFTLVDSFDQDNNVDAKIGSKIMLAVADAMRFNSGLLLKASLNDLVKADTNDDKRISRYLTELLCLFGDDDSLKITDNKKVEQVLTDVADLVTGAIKGQNEKIKKNILQVFERL